jgi:hypothetical protein
MTKSFSDFLHTLCFQKVYPHVFLFYISFSLESKRDRAIDLCIHSYQSVKISLSLTLLSFIVFRGPVFIHSKMFPIFWDNVILIFQATFLVPRGTCLFQDIIRNMQLLIIHFHNFHNVHTSTLLMYKTKYSRPLSFT